jgi:pantothenate kinase
MPPRWFVDVPPETARERLIKRHVLAGIEKTRQAAAARVEENDIRNGELIRARLLLPEVVINN